MLEPTRTWMMLIGYPHRGSLKLPSRNLRFLVQYPLPLHHRCQGEFLSLGLPTGWGRSQLLDEPFSWKGFLSIFFHFHLFLGYDSWTERHCLLCISWFWITVFARNPLYHYDGEGLLPTQLQMTPPRRSNLPPFIYYISPFSSASVY